MLACNQEVESEQINQGQLARAQPSQSWPQVWNQHSHHHHHPKTTLANQKTDLTLRWCSWWRTAAALSHQTIALDPFMVSCARSFVKIISTISSRYYRTYCCQTYIENRFVLVVNINIKRGTLQKLIFVGHSAYLNKNYCSILPTVETNSI